MYILGISAYYHDSAAVLIEDGKIIAAAQEERFSRKKHDSRFPKNAIIYCLKEAEISLEEVSVFAFLDKPFLKIDRLIETYYTFPPKGISSFTTRIPVWSKEKMFLKRELRKSLAEIGRLDKDLKFLFP